MLRRLFGLKKRKPEPLDEAACQAWDESKSSILEQVLGKEHNMVLHAMIPYAVGGGLDLYIYPNHPAGTAIATKELVKAPHQGPSNRVYDAYELVMCTRVPLDASAIHKPETPFGGALARINGVLNAIARYSVEAELNPQETCEFPDTEELGDLRGRCLIFETLSPPDVSNDIGVGLLLVMEVHRSEMDYAREHGSAELLDKLKGAGHFPCSDMNRKPVV